MRPVIDIRNVHRIFESEAGCAHILHNVSLAVDPGEFVAITGPSGSGKSTLMNILGCLDKPTAGDYYLQGLNVAELDDDELTEVRALSIGFVFQSFNLLMQRTCLKNVCFPMELGGVPAAQARKRALELLDLVGLADAADKKLKTLSGGMRQRVAVLRAMRMDADFLLLDEPFRGLDAGTKKKTMNYIRRKGKEKTMLLVTHDLEEAEAMGDWICTCSRLDGILEIKRNSKSSTEI